MASSEPPDILDLFDAMKRTLAEGPSNALPRPIAKTRPRFACATCHDLRRVHYVQDSGTGAYDTEPGGEIPCPDCAIDESLDALERVSFR